ncbi:helix-turn-helix domain-containing protein [Actinomycetospora lutea]|uniref:helix-turn-helix domain-containing protein n=1 Tax=Actinomycetospora lutea TaxID=663604 RepID=UPI002365ADF9|nr:helix-turn-helix domain-containing protein [Actinomycetospora lutea]MDD7941701.1 helix-turn-helix domain-containing protein [Actinomycetospora lutea]
MTGPDADARLDALEARVAALEERAGGPAPVDPGRETGEIGYHGDVRLQEDRGPVTWTIGYDAAATLGLATGPVAEVLAALGHPVRLALVRRLLAGPAGTGELVEAAELSSSGQLYHHLRTLTAARVVEQDGRTYHVPDSGVVPVLVALLAAADLAGTLR